jgi:hypothetical protein
MVHKLRGYLETLLTWGMAGKLAVSLYQGKLARIINWLVGTVATSALKCPCPINQCRVGEFANDKENEKVLEPLCCTLPRQSTLQFSAIKGQLYYIAYVVSSHLSPIQ